MSTSFVDGDMALPGGERIAVIESFVIGFSFRGAEIMGLKINQLSCLLAVASTGSFRKAAQSVGIAQPSLSAQISALEDHLGVSLVERSSAGALLTPAGRKACENAVEVLDALKQLEVDARESNFSRVVRLGVKATLGPYIMPDVVKRLHAAHPELRLFIAEGAPRDLEIDLVSGVHDVILAQLPVSNPAFESSLVFREPLFLAVAADDVLAKKKHFEPSDLAEREVLTLSPRFHLHDQVMLLCRQHGARLRQDYEGTSLDALRQMVGMGLGVTLLPALYASSEVQYGEDVVVLPQKKTTLYRSIGVAWRRKTGREPAIKAFTETLREVARNKSSVVAV